MPVFVKAKTSRLLLLTFAFAAAVAVLLRPWRNAVGQDDASYAAFADSIFRGHWTPPAILLSAAWPQVVVGALFRGVLGFLPALSAYMFAAFCAYVFNFLCFLQAASRKSSSAFFWLVSFFIFPVTVQYGTAFLTETFVISLLCVFALSLKRWLEARTWPSAVMLVLSIVFIVLQRQTYLIFPLAAAALLFLDVVGKKRGVRDLAPLVIGIAAALFAYVVVPKTSLQTVYFRAVIAQWRAFPGADGVLIFLDRVFQFVLAIGIFLTPLVFQNRLTVPKILKTLFAQCAVAVLIFILPANPLYAGVLFTGYLPRIVGSVFISFGVWGIGELWGRLSAYRKRTLFILLSAAFGFIGFSTFLMAEDVKYVLPAAYGILLLLILFDFRPTSGPFVRGPRLLAAYLIIVGLVSLVANKYYLDTIDQRSELAAEYEHRGLPQNLISAGYGRDSYVLGDICVEDVFKKLSRLSPDVYPQEFQHRLVDMNPRQYADEAVFQVIIKPWVIMGKTVNLSENRLAGQSNTPSRIVPYRVLGLPNALAVYENAAPHAAWCFQP